MEIWNNVPSEVAGLIRERGARVQVLVDDGTESNAAREVRRQRVVKARCKRRGMDMEGKKEEMFFVWGSFYLTSNCEVVV